MSVIDTLITDRAQSDVERVSYLSSLWVEGEFTGTSDELSEWISPLKGTYNATDLNRVQSACEYIAERLSNYGYSVSLIALPEWTVTDIPVQSQMQDYLANVQTLRDTIEVLQTTPQVPESMALLDWVGANNIEQILVDLETVINRTFMSFLRSGQFTFWSGYRPLPAAESWMGRTWAELDAMNTTWANWQVADWYLLLYGNLEAEGVVT